MAKVIEFDNVRYSYSADAPAIDDVSLSVDAGEFVCLIGSNGSGKSTIARHMNALLVPDEGAVTVLGHRLGSPYPQDTTSNREDLAAVYAIRSNVGFVFQNPDDQIVASLVEDDVAFGPSNLGIPADELRERVTKSLERVGLAGFERRETSTLSGGEKQRVALAGALAMEPQILVLDEPDAMLDPQGRADLMTICHALRKAGMTIVLITHFMDEAAQADRVIALDAGHVVMDGTPEQVLTQVERLEQLKLEPPFTARLCHALRNRGLDVPLLIDENELLRRLANLHASSDMSLQFPTAHADNARSIDDSCIASSPILQMQHVSFRYDNASAEALHDISLEVRNGEVLGIAGRTGSGKSTLAQIAGGLMLPSQGHVLVQGVDLSRKSAARESRRTIGVVFQYPERQLFAATVYDDVAFGPRNLGVPENDMQAWVRGALELVHLDFDELKDKSPFALSGGQQRRVAIAGVLALKPRILILDEPAAGLDPHARNILLNLISELQRQQQLTVVIVSHNMDDLAALCNRIIVLNEGAIARDGRPSSVFANEAALIDTGLAVPFAQHMLQRLRQSGIMAAPSRELSDIPTIGDLANIIEHACA